MNALDIIIIAMVISSVFRGFELGLIRQIFSTAGFIGGLLLGAWLQHYTVQLAHTSLSRSVITIITTLGLAAVFLVLGELLGKHLKDRASNAHVINKSDSYFGSLIGALTLLFTIWLTAAVVVVFPFPEAQAQIRGSRIITNMNQSLPPAPGVIASLGRLIDPNGFPQVFAGNEPDQPANTTVPGISPALQQAIDKTKASAVKFEGLGCGGVVDGSGFVIGPDLVATNAHVLAGVRHPFVEDTNGQHSATAVWFDPNLDFAIVKTKNLAGPPLLISNSIVPKHTRAAILGYPGGGPLKAGGAEILDDFTARGRDIYGDGLTERDVYSMAADVIPGNSGGPVIATDGTVIGVVFAQSTVNENVGYSLSTPQIQAAISQAQAQNRAISTGNCTE